MHNVDLERLAKRAGDDAAGRLDTDRVVGRVLDRLRHEGDGRDSVAAHPRRTPWLRAAAAVALLVTGGLVVRGLLMTDHADAGFPIPLAWEQLETEEWNEVLDSLTYQAPVHDFVATPTLYDLNEEQLRELLDQLES